ncbi:MAG: YciI family protein [Sphingobium sp.]
MPCYSIVARDYPDALERRMAIRSQHVALSDTMVAAGQLVFGAAIVEEGKMYGSVLIGRFADRAEIDTWLAGEPYVTGRVWESWNISEIQMGQSYAAFFPSLV